ncbi:hypothetical protein GMAR_ORF226 [Golden Marseillevirus]|uniref:hypothetical protein n=1 Tax=Golden Marseillevirus TaxID=1720526 RepID=UPI000877AEF2|nr:hypothetical protein GMAR_ORF226 [Golden Marseillevirus]ALX27600.1 hypothetical protein GMAR_ORF226 [Golden Marseillevirus]
MSGFENIKAVIEKEYESRKNALVEFLCVKFEIKKEDMDAALSEFGVAPTATKKPTRPRKVAEKREKVQCAGFTLSTGKPCGLGAKEEIDGKMYCPSHVKRLRKTQEEVDFAVSGAKKDKKETTSIKNSKLEGYLNKISTNRLQKSEKSGNLVHTEHGLVFDEETKSKVIGFEAADGQLLALTEAQQALCVEMGWEMDVGNIPLQKDEEDKEKESDSESDEDEPLDVGDDELDIGDERH